MKTIKTYTVLGLVLIITAVTSAFAGSGPGGGAIIQAKQVRYQVNLHGMDDKNLCNSYSVVILNSEGAMVAPPKPYIPGVNSYDFFESGPIVYGVRLATLVLDNMQANFSCDTQLYTSPSKLGGPFKAGEIYRFDLFPKTIPIK